MEYYSGKAQYYDILVIHYLLVLLKMMISQY
jgi:hypothetical protein